MILQEALEEVFLGWPSDSDEILLAVGVESALCEPTEEFSSVSESRRVAYVFVGSIGHDLQCPFLGFTEHRYLVLSQQSFFCFYCLAGDVFDVLEQILRYSFRVSMICSAIFM